MDDDTLVCHACKTKYSKRQDTLYWKLRDPCEILKDALITMTEMGRSNPECNSQMLWNRDWQELRDLIFIVYDFFEGK